MVRWKGDKKALKTDHCSDVLKVAWTDYLMVWSLDYCKAVLMDGNSAGLLAQVMLLL
jgi:hypothetical protein